MRTGLALDRTSEHVVVTSVNGEAGPELTETKCKIIYTIQAR